MNLAVNARDAMPDGGRIAIETWNETIAGPFDGAPDAVAGRYSVLSVRDTGTGMPPEVIRRIFEPFFTTKPAGSGTGLGLSTVYGIIRQAKGFVTVSSEVGHGTVFRAFLPWTDLAEVKATPEAAGAASVGSGTVLLVEDQDEVRKFALMVLSQNGYRVLEAKDGAEALAMEAAHPGTLEILLTDMVMPGMSGWDLASRLRARRPGLCVVFISGYPPEGDADRAIDAATFLGKPFTAASLLSKMRQAREAVPAPA
jgi:CheY-like chemotaxis protein